MKRDMYTDEVWAALQYKLENCGYLDARTIEGAFDSVIGEARRLGLSRTDIVAMVQRRPDGAPYPERTAEEDEN